MTTKNLIPRASGEGGIGIDDVTWGHGYYDTGNFNKGLFVSGHNITQVIAETVTQGGLGGEWTKAVNNLDIYFDGGNVGIGTTTPGAQLDIVDDNNSTQLIVRGRSSDSFGIIDFRTNNGTTSKGMLKSDASNNLMFRAGPSNDIVTITPNGKLEVEGGVPKIDLVRTQVGGDVNGFELKSLGDGVNINARSGLIDLTTPAANGAAGATMRFSTINGGTTHTTLALKDGNVGIGITDPGNNKLKIAGGSLLAENIVSVVASDSNMVLANPTTEQPYLKFDGRNSTTGLNWSLGIDDSDPNVEKNLLSIKRWNDNIVLQDTPFVVDSNGKVGIGTTNPDTKLTVDGDLRIQAGDGTQDNMTLLSGTFATTDNSNSVIGSNGAQFLKELLVDDLVYINLLEYTVTSITSNELMTVSPAVQVGAPGVGGYRITKRELIYADDRTANIGIGTADPECPLMIYSNPVNDSMFKMFDSRGYVPDAEISSISFQGWDSNNARQAFGGIAAYANGERGGLVFSARKVTGSVLPLMVLSHEGNVGINTTNPTAPLEISSTTGGVIMPRMTTTDRGNIANPTDGEMIYNTTTNKFNGYANGGWVDLH
jgi:hypothetical protein